MGLCNIQFDSMKLINDFGKCKVKKIHCKSKIILKPLDIKAVGGISASKAVDFCQNR